MSEKKPILSLTGAIIILSICILISAFIISSAIRDSSSNHVIHDNSALEIYKLNENFVELLKILEGNN